MFRSVLIANRGEIACRIARTAKRLGMRTIAVYSAADAGALHVQLCDEAHLIGPAEARDSYLSIERLIDVAKTAGAQCIHPGYEFLSENADFVDAATQAGLVFIGPPAEAIRAMGLKDRAKALMERAGVPIVPGYHGDRQDIKFLKQKAYETGYPVLIKPAAGGGGRGLRRVDKHAEPSRRRSRVPSAKPRPHPRCRPGADREIYRCAAPYRSSGFWRPARQRASISASATAPLQRRHQKVVEEAPAPGMTAELRTQMGADAVEAVRAVGYVGAGTVEFIADGTSGLRQDAFWFIEMNTRLQVEHPVTEAVTGLDLVEWQFRVAAGEKLPLKQSEVRIEGHAVEARVYAEDPENGFLPSTGPILALVFPGDIRVDSGVEAGGNVTPYYDAMIAKLIAHAPTRQGAIDRLAQALERTTIVGPRSNVAFLAALCRTAEFRAGRIDTDFIDRNLANLAAPRGMDSAAAALGVADLLAGNFTGEPVIEAGQEAAEGSEPHSPWAARDGFQLGGVRSLAIPIVADGENATAMVTYGARGMQVAVGGSAPATDAKVFEAGGEAYVLRHSRQTRVHIKNSSVAENEAGAGDGVIKAPMHGRVLEILARAGDRVSGGQRLAVIEAMKMEHTLRAPFAGVVLTVAAAVGAQVVEGGEIMVIEPGQDA